MRPLSSVHKIKDCHHHYVLVMSTELRGVKHSSTEGRGRPYRSHAHPACLPCRARKSQCKTGDASSCVMCQTHGTDCVFPQAAERPRKKTGHTKRNTSFRGRHSMTSSHTQALRTRCLSSTSPTPSQRALQSYSPPRNEQRASTNEAIVDHPERSSPSIGHQDNSIPTLIDIIAKSAEGSSHVVSPAIADDDRVFQEYLFSNTPYGQSKRMVRFHLNLNNPGQHTRPILFNTAPKRGKRESESRSLAASYCEIIERLVEPYQDDLIHL